MSRSRPWKNHPKQSQAPTEKSRHDSIIRTGARRPGLRHARTAELPISPEDSQVLQSWGRALRREVRSAQGSVQAETRSSGRTGFSGWLTTLSSFFRSMVARMTRPLQLPKSGHAPRSGLDVNAAPDQSIRPRSFLKPGIRS